MENIQETKTKVQLTHHNIAKETFLRRQKLIDSIGPLEKSVYTDELTGLDNEKAFNKMLRGLQSSWERSKEGQKNQGTIIEFDLDGLKIANFNYGEKDGGDQYLVSVARSLNDVLRPEDRSFRLGQSSDTFVLHLPKYLSKKNKNKILNRIDEKLNFYQDMCQEKYPGIVFGLSASIVSYGNIYSPEEAFKFADAGMKKAKESKYAGERVLNVGRIFS